MRRGWNRHPRNPPAVRDQSGWQVLLNASNGRIRAEVRDLEQARLYALRADVDFVYGFVPETSLAGEYIPNRCY